MYVNVIGFTTFQHGVSWYSDRVSKYESKGLELKSRQSSHFYQCLCDNDKTIWVIRNLKLSILGCTLRTKQKRYIVIKRIRGFAYFATCAILCARKIPFVYQI